MKSRTRGFTLMELMIALAVAAIILTLAVPNFSRFRLNNRLSNAANDALSVITRARTDAIKRQISVSLCASTVPNAAAPTCSDGAIEGLISFIDLNNNCLRDSGEDLLGTTTYEVLDSSANPLRVRTNGNCMSFASTGFRQNIASRISISRMTFCDDRGLALLPGTTMSAGRGVSVSSTGRARITRTTSGSGVANGEGRADDMSLWDDATCS